MDNPHKSAIVTGASGGIGRARARRLAHDVVMVADVERLFQEAMDTFGAIDV